MEIDAIKKLIETDENTRAEVEAQYQKRLNLKKAVEEKKKKLSQEAWDNVNRQVKETKQKLDAMITNDVEENKKNYAEASKLMQDTFDANKKTWKDEIVERIIHSA